MAEKKMNARQQMIAETTKQLARVRAERRKRPVIKERLTNARQRLMSAFSRGE